MKLTGKADTEKRYTGFNEAGAGTGLISRTPPALYFTPIHFSSTSG
jgi:hypothetical protein